MLNNLKIKLMYSDKKKVLIITGVFKPEPVVSAGLMSDLAESLSANYDVTVIHPKPSRPLGFVMPKFDYNSLNYKVVQSDSYVYPASHLKGRLKETISMGRWCAKYIKQHQGEIDFVYIASWQLWGREIIARACVKCNIPYITPVQDVYPDGVLAKLPQCSLIQWPLKKLLMPSDLYLLGHAKKIHTISDKMVDYLCRTRNLQRDKFVVVRNWQDESRFTSYVPNKRTDNAPFTFMFLGSIGPTTGLDQVITAFHRANLTEAQFVIAGNGSAKESLIAQAKELGISNVIFYEAPFDKVPEIQSKADVMVLPLKKGIGLTSVPSKMPAYMFSAKPILASVESGCDSAACLLRSKSGWVAAPEDVEDIARKMKEAYNTPLEELHAMGKRGFDFSIQHFSKKVNLKILADACRDVIENTSK